MTGEAQVTIAVWPFPTPPVCTAMWEARDWESWAASHRPSGYPGGQFDQDAWTAWVEARERRTVEDWYAAHPQTQKETTHAQ